MRTLLNLFARATTGRPGIVVVTLVLLTALSALLASNLELEVNLVSLGSEESSSVQTMQRIGSEFGDPTAMIQVMVDRGEGGNILSPAGLEQLAEVQERVVEALGEDIRVDRGGEPLLQSLPAMIDRALGMQGTTLSELGEDQTAATVSQLLAGNPQLASFLSEDLSLEEGRARGTFLIAMLDPDLTSDQRTSAGQRVADAFGIESGSPVADYGNARITVFSNGLFEAGMLDAVRAEVPQLFALALLAVIVILALMYRSFFDLAIGMAGLVMTVVMTFGLIALLGPGFLGWIGPFSQLGVIVPVLLVGLGIDYSVHLTSRYREQRQSGDGPQTAAATALDTVGTALVLATLGTAVGFAANATAPVRMIADFGVFVALGVVCAFLVMGLFVPSARVMRDRRRAKQTDEGVRTVGLGGLLKAPARLAVTAPLAGLAVALLLAALSLLAATQLEVELERSQFVPQGSDVEAVLDLQGELFGASLNEGTYVLVDGDLTRPEVLDAMWRAQQDLAGVEGVRTLDGAPLLRSVVGLVATAANQNPALPIPWTGDGFEPNANMSFVFNMLRLAVGQPQVDQLLTPENDSALIRIQTTAGDAGAERLRARVEQAFAPVEALGASVAVTSEQIIMGQMSEALSSFQAQAIGITLAVVLVLLSGYYWLSRRTPLLGAIALLPAAISASLVLGTMWLLGISFNALTATLTAIAIGIGVPYGIHVVNRFTEALSESATAEAACNSTIANTGGALAGSALTTLGAFAVLSFSSLPPIRSLGLLGGVSIAIALLSALLVEPGALLLWERRTRRAAAGDSSTRDAPT